MDAELEYYLIVKYHELRYAVAVRVVREILRLPELTPLEEVPYYIVGVFNLRGKVVPVMDMDLRHGRKPDQYRLSDLVLVLQWEKNYLGLIVHDIVEVRTLASDSLETPPMLWDAHHHGKSNHLISHVAKVEEGILMVLDPMTLATYHNAISLADDQSEKTIEIPLGHWEDYQRVFCPEATTAEKLVFSDRAKKLMPKQTDFDEKDRLPLAVIALCGEYFALDLNLVKGFAHIRQYTPIPCCPSHIVGNMNLRGEILTLINLNEMLNLAAIELKPTTKAVVVFGAGSKVGIAVEEIVDLIYIRPQDISKTPVATSTIHLDCLKGVAPFGENMVTILDLERILHNERLIVNEEV